MKDQFADYETAKMLKELGYPKSQDGKHFGWYRVDKNILVDRDIPSRMQSHFNTILAPLWKQVKEWLWEQKHRPSIMVYRFGTYYFYYIEFAVTKEKLPNSKEKFNSPIEAEIEGIKRAVEYLYKKIKK